MDRAERDTLRGRPPKRPGSDSELAAGSLSRTAILDYALELTRRDALQDISLVRLAQSLDVRTNAVRYHVGSRDGLLTGVMNLFFRKLFERLERVLEKTAGNRSRIIMAGTEWLELKSEYPGITRYILAQDRFRMFQDPPDGERDYGAAYVDAMFSLFARAGLKPAEAAELWHVMALLTTATAEHITMHHAPSNHGDFLLHQAGRFKRADFPGIAVGIPALVRLDARKAFDRHLRALVDTFLDPGPG